MPLDSTEKKRLQDKARYIREEIINTTEKCGGSHIGGAMSQTDLMVALYYKYMKIDKNDPALEDRDRFILSKGHGGVGHAVILADVGFVKMEDVYDFNKTGSPFGMHLDRIKVAGVDASTGSLGHGLGIGVGMAMGAKMKNMDYHTYCIVGDGELNEGSNWEAAMAASHYKVANMTCIVDRNMLMIDGETENVMSLEPLKGKFEAFGYKVLECDGHDFDSICDAIDESLATKDKPVCIIANTIKGKGIDFMENLAQWHYAGLDSETAKKALESVRKS